jgi:hypothetical protein
MSASMIFSPEGHLDVAALHALQNKLGSGSNGMKLTQVATYKQSMLEAKTTRKTFHAKPRAVTA